MHIESRYNGSDRYDLDVLIGLNFICRKFQVEDAACPQGFEGQYTEMGGGLGLPYRNPNAVVRIEAPSFSRTNSFQHLTASCTLKIQNYSYSGQYWCSACSYVSQVSRSSIKLSWNQINLAYFLALEFCNDFTSREPPNALLLWILQVSRPWTSRWSELRCNQTPRQPSSRLGIPLWVHILPFT